ncbi:MAG: hypothetical protein GY845_03330 [Planctomycetes bacterium]|nr:hypothetical protein [Planctomycetota bacterium]
MFEFIKSMLKKSPEDQKLQEDIEAMLEEPTEAIAAPAKPPPSYGYGGLVADPETLLKYNSSNYTFEPVDVVAPTQSIPGKFNYHSATWKYLQNYLNVRITSLHRKNENQKLSLDRTQLIRGQIKEIKALLKHTNHLAGISVSPTNTSLDTPSTDKGPIYE